MVGVPSSKACDACRAQRKKCIGTAPCTRCRRLNIACIGNGQTRYKFVEDKRASPPNGTVHAVQRRAINDDRSTVARMPSNAYTVLAAMFTGTVNPGTDIRFQLPWNFGDFLLDIPRRLGHSEALDATCRTLAISYHQYCGNKTPDVVPILQSHAKAIHALRKSLDDPVKAQSSETLAALLLLQIGQVRNPRLEWRVNTI